MKVGWLMCVGEGCLGACCELRVVMQLLLWCSFTVTFTQMVALTKHGLTIATQLLRLVVAR